LKGEVRVEQTLEDDAVFEVGRRVILWREEGGSRETEIELFRRQHGRCVAKFRGIDSISAAEKLIGWEVQIAADTLPQPQAGWFYTFQLKGCRVVGLTGEYIGVVTDVIDSGGNEILQVEHGNKETLIPFAHEYIRTIDLDKREIRVDLPEDLRELNK